MQKDQQITGFIYLYINIYISYISFPEGVVPSAKRPAQANDPSAPVKSSGRVINAQQGTREKIAAAATQSDNLTSRVMKQAWWLRGGEINEWMPPPSRSTVVEVERRLAIDRFISTWSPLLNEQTAKWPSSSAGMRPPAVPPSKTPTSWFLHEMSQCDTARVGLRTSAAEKTRGLDIGGSRTRWRKKEKKKKSVNIISHLHLHFFISLPFIPLDVFLHLGHSGEYWPISRFRLKGYSA